MRHLLYLTLSVSRIFLFSNIAVDAIEDLNPKDILRLIQDNNHPPPQYEKLSPDSNGVSENYMTQKLNHFPSSGSGSPIRSSDNSISSSSFEQRYFHSSRFVIPSDKNVRGSVDASKSRYAFLCVGGEGPAMSKSVLVDSVHCTGDMLELAERLYDGGKGVSVDLYALEHRYYGKSYPDVTFPTSSKNIVHLSSKQALADLAHFIQTTNKDNNSNNNDVKWITFGGSYPGMLAAWARLKYPDLVHAALSNSSPVEAKLDFGGYNDHISSVLKDQDIGGSEDCLEIVRSGHEEIVKYLSKGKEGRSLVAQSFNVCGGEESLENKMNARVFVGDGVVHIPAQENDPSCERDLCNVDKVCKALLDMEGSSLDRLATLSAKQSGQQCKNISWDAYLKVLSTPMAKAGGTRSWLYQTCTEFGFYQTCNIDSQCPYGRGYHTVDQDLEMCSRVFSVEASEVRAAVQSTLEYYGGLNLEGDRIMFVNGDVDPWSVLSVTDDERNLSLPTKWIKGSSHHFWTHQVKESDGEEISDGREDIYLQLEKWLKEDKTNVELVSSLN